MADRTGKDDLELASYVNGLLSREMTRQRKEHPKWYLSLSYLHGQQWVFYDERRNIVDEIPRISLTDRRMTINRTAGNVEQVLAQLTASNPKWLVAPNFTSEAGVLASRSWQQWYDWVWRTKNLERLLRDQVLVWAVVTGRGWLRITWDAQSGRKRTVRLPVDPEVTEPEKNEQSILDAFAGPEEPQFREEQVPEGDFSFKAPSPFNVFIDPAAQSADDIRWLMEVSYVHRQEVEALYDTEVTPDVHPVPAINYSQRVRAGLQKWGEFQAGASLTGNTTDGKYIAGTGLYASTDDFTDVVLLKELWVAPTPEYPQGRYVVVANDKVLHEGDNPYGRIPYVPFVWSPRQGSVYCDGLIWQIKDLQFELNKAYSRLSVLMLVSTAPPWVVDARSQIDPNAFSDRPNSIVLHQTPLGGTPPFRPAPPNVAGNFVQWIQLLERQMEEIAGLRSADRGVNPEGVRSAETVKALIGASLQGRMPAINRYKEALQDVGLLVMEITRRYVQEDRLVATIGRDGVVSVTEFTRSDIEQGTDVRVIVGEGLPEDPADRQDYLLGMIRMGVYNMQDEGDRKQIRRLLEFGEVRSFYDDDTTCERLRIHGENLRMLAGQPVEVKEYDLHLQHAEGHTSFMRSPEAQAAFAQDPALEQAFRTHKDQHLDWLSAGQAPVPMIPNSTPAPGQLVPPAGGGAGSQTMGVGSAGLLGPSAAPPGPMMGR